jgi:putative PIN family toxin of toxin-antitoxin system
MKVVLDSNIFVSSFYWQGNPRRVFDRIINRYDELYITDEILEEISAVMLLGKFDTKKHEVEGYIKIIERYAKKIFPKNRIENVSRDKDDDKILQCGVEGNVDFIITGDKDLLVLKEYKNIKIIKPKDYLENIS